MASEPTSSWHPALMPNGPEDHVASAVPAPEKPESETNDGPESSGEQPAIETNAESGADAWFADDGEDAGDAWLASDHPEVPAADDAIAESEPENRPEIVAAETEDPSASRTPAKHSSSMSFARTVSHEVNFNDDDEGDWSLPRTNTDPFKFMPANNRTNSFPVVPMAETTPEAPLPSSQALDVLEETEKDVVAEDHEYEDNDSHHGVALAPPEQQSSHGSRHKSSGSIGGDVLLPEVEDANARFEEGVPLMSHRQEEPAGSFGDSFGDEDGNDDFFNQIQGTEPEQAGAPEDDIKGLERKSTMQVLDAVTPGALTHQDTISETPEETQGETLDAQPEPELLSTLDEPKLGNEKEEDLSAKWSEAFGGGDDDEDFLLEDSAKNNEDFDAAAFLGSDDEGLLEETEDPPAVASTPQAPQSNTYAPQQARPSYMPASASTSQIPAASSMGSIGAAPGAALPAYGTVPRTQPELRKAESFADKAKGGYSSPYDLPTDLASVVKPRKRPSMQHLGGSSPAVSGPAAGLPPRSTSMTVGAMPHNAAPPAAVRPPSSHGPTSVPPLAHKASEPALRKSGGFFEDLPMSSKPRPASRHSNRGPSPQTTHLPPSMPSPPRSIPPPMSSQSSSDSRPTSSQAQAPPPVANLVAPERVSPYANLPTSAPSVPAPSTSRYSPASGAPLSGSGAPPAAAMNRYSPAPPIPRSSSSYSPTNSTTAPPPMLPHQPRTSSPLAHFEVRSAKHPGAAHAGNVDAPSLDRRSSASYEPRLNRVPSLPPTREVEEEEDREAAGSHAGLLQSPPPPAASSRYSPVPASMPSQPQSQAPAPGPSPYAPQQPAQARPPMPQQPSTQSLGAASGPPQSPVSPNLSKPSSLTFVPGHRARGPSITMSMVSPTDGREQDPLQRWKGVPIFAWGVGGTVVTSFPQSIPRYSGTHSMPSLLRSPGEVKVRNVKVLAPLEERLAKFPGPLRGKSKKKEALAWLSAGIETLEKDLPDMSFNNQLSLEDKRSVERLLLWKILRVFIDNDGVLEGSPAVDKAVREVLSPETSFAATDAAGGASLNHGFSGGAPMHADGVDSAVIDQIRQNLLRGEKEAAVWAAVDKRLWGHAMLISQVVSLDLYKQVAAEFVRKEVNFSGRNNESLAALYKIMSGNYDDCVDELVPAHERAGLQLISTMETSNVSHNTMEGLDKWRETLTLVLSNRSSDDIKGLKALGNLLSSYGRAEAAHVCYLFSRNVSTFGGMDDPNVDFVLLGLDHRQQPDQFAKDIEALQLTEAYEYGLSLSGATSAAAGAPHLAAYKLQHAIILSEYGFRDKALQYCEAIATAVTAQTRRSPYHHALLVTSVDEFMTRLKQAPRGESGSWMSKPNMNKVSDSMWNRFNKFVAGDENEHNGNGASGDGESGPFARISTTPNLSRSPSVTNFDPYGGGSPGYMGNGAPLAPPSMPSRYAPMSAQQGNGTPSPYEPASKYAPANASMERSSMESTRSPYEPAYPGASNGYAQSGDGMSPGLGVSVGNAGYQPSIPSMPAAEPPTSYQPSTGGFAPYGSQEQPATPQYQESAPQAEPVDQGYQPMSYGYSPPEQTSMPEPAHDQGQTEDSGFGGYAPPSTQSYGYEPPTFNPGPSADDEDDAPKPKKKSFMDDDEDDIPALRQQTGQSKADKDRENQEMFRKAAEEDAKRAAAQQAEKKGWGFGGWFGGAKKAETPPPGEAGKPIRAKLGEASSFVYDPDLKRWINKKAGAENVEAKTATPPPPRAMPRTNTGTPPPPGATPPPMGGRSSVPPPMGAPRSVPGPTLNKSASIDVIGSPPPMIRSDTGASAASGVSGPPSAPPSRPTTSMSNASSIDDLLSAAGPRKAGGKKPRKSGRYVDVMAKT